MLNGSDDGFFYRLRRLEAGPELAGFSVDLRAEPTAASSWNYWNLNPLVEPLSELFEPDPL